LANINSLIFFKFVGQVIDQPEIEVLTAQMGVTIGGFDFKYPLTDLQYGDVKCTAA
jgi:hypothetical protein